MNKKGGVGCGCIKCCPVSRSRRVACLARDQGLSVILTLVLCDVPFITAIAVTLLTGLPRSWKINNF